MTDYIILPREIETGTYILDRLYKQMSIMKMLKDKHQFIPPVNFKKIPLSFFSNYTVIPHHLSGDDLELLDMYEREEVDTFIGDINELLENYGEDFLHSNIYNYLNLFYKKYSRGDYQLQSGLPVPVFSGINLYYYKEIAGNLSNNLNWLLQLVDFYQFLTEELLFIGDIKADDFFYTSTGNIKYFLNYHQLSLRSDRSKLLFNNMESLANLLNDFYLRDTETQGANLYRDSYFEKIEGRLIKPLIYENSSETIYRNFREIKLDLKDNLTINDSQKKIGVFLDIANIFKVMDSGTGKMRINFNKLLTRIYGKIESRKIKKKVAVMFVPSYQEDGKNRDIFNILIDIKDYLQKSGFKVLEVENDTPRAKQIIEGEEIDIDDQKLIDIIYRSRHELDSILIFTGDRHFYDIARKYRELGKEVKIISLTEKSTFRGFINDFKHHFLYEYWDCIEYSLKGSDYGDI